MPATVIAERIDWQRGITVLKERVAELRPVVPYPSTPCSAPSTGPASSPSGTCGSPPSMSPWPRRGGRFPVVVGVSGHSRSMAACMVPSREAHDVLGGHLACLRSFGAVPRLGVYDQEGCIGQWRGRRAVFTDAFNSFRGVLGMGSVLCARGDPEANEVAESFWATLKQRVRQPLPLRQPDGGPLRHHRVDPSLQRDPSPLLDRWRSADRVGASLPSHH